VSSTAVPPDRFWVPLINVVPLSVPPEKTFSTPPLETGSLVAVPPAKTLTVPPMTLVSLATPPL